jgi:parallel beta-helix repeat protein
MKVSSTATLIIVILLCTVSAVSAAELQVHEGESIQAAINMAKPGDTIFVHNGTYTENVVVNKSDILIRSANGSAVTIVESNRTDMHVFKITDQKNVRLEGFTIRDASAALNTTRDDKVHSHAISAVVLPPEYQYGSIRVTSTPSGATIYVDTYLGWSHKGKTPNTIARVSPDYYTIKLSLTGYQDWTKKIHVAAGETAHIHATLSQASGSISVTSSPSDALMYLDDQYRGKTPHTITAVSPGYHIIKLTLADYLDWSKEVHVTAGETACFDAKMTPILGAISVTSSPSGAKIYLDDRYRGKTPHRVTEVSSGYHTLRLTLDGYLDWSTNLQVRAGETSDVAAIMIPSFTQAGIYMNNASNCVIKNNKIINCGQGILIASGSNNTIERNIIRDDTIAGTGVRIERSATNTGIHENCFIDNVPQAWDDGADNNWLGNYWSPPPGGPSNYIIPGAAGSEDNDPLDECPMKEQST